MPTRFVSEVETRLLEDAFKKVGITSRQMKRGEMYLVRDELIVLPEERIPTRQKREIHKQRPVLILQADDDNTDVFYPLVLVAPLSHRVDLQDERGYHLAAGQGGLEEDSIVLLSLVQPILKTDLEADPIGKLDALTMNDIDAILAANLGFIERPGDKGDS